MTTRPHPAWISQMRAVRLQDRPTCRIQSRQPGIPRSDSYGGFPRSLAQSPTHCPPSDRFSIRTASRKNAAIINSSPERRTPTRQSSFLPRPPTAAAMPFCNESHAKTRTPSSAGAKPGRCRFSGGGAISPMRRRKTARLRENHVNQARAPSRQARRADIKNPAAARKRRTPEMKRGQPAKHAAMPGYGRRPIWGFRCRRGTRDRFLRAVQRACRWRPKSARWFRRSRRG